MKKSNNMIRNLIFFILLIILTFWIILKDQNMEEMFDALASVKIEFILIGVIFMFVYLMLEGINLGRTLKALNEKTSFWKNLKYAFVGFFFSSITPAASGGQPMQAYYMYKDKISVANSTLALLMNLCSFQIVTISCALFSVMFNFQYLENGLIWFFVLGIVLNSSALALLLIGIFSKRLSAALVNFAVKILKLFRMKNLDKKKQSLEETLNKYQGSAEYIKSHKHVMVKILLTTFFQVLVYYSIPYWVYCSFGLADKNILQVMMLQAILYATVSGIPSPGAVGVSEGGFIEIFKTVFPATAISGAMLLNRGVNFYLYVLLSGIVVVVNIIRIQNKLSRKS